MFELLVSAQLESLYICVSLDYLMTLQDFFISGLPTTSNDNISRSNTSEFNTEKDKSTKINRVDTEKSQVKLDRQQLSRTKSQMYKPTTSQLKSI